MGVDHLVASVALTGVMGGLALGGFAYADFNTKAVDDVDCEFAGGPHDEPPGGCFEYCIEEPMWYGWGSETRCYWDDEPPTNPDDGGDRP